MVQKAFRFGSKHLYGDSSYKSFQFMICALSLIVMKNLLKLILVIGLTSKAFGKTVIEKVNVKVIDPSKAKCVVKINPGPPTTVDIDAESLFEANDLTVSS